MKLFDFFLLLHALDLGLFIDFGFLFRVFFWELLLWLWLWLVVVGSSVWVEVIAYDWVTDIWLFLEVAWWFDDLLVFPLNASLHIFKLDKFMQALLDLVEISWLDIVLVLFQNLIRLNMLHRGEIS